MKLSFITALVFLFTVTTAFCQSSLLTPAQADKVFNTAIKKEFGLDFPIYRVYQYNDKTGKSYIALTEQNDGIDGKDTLHHKIKAVNVKIVDGKFQKQWEINDFTSKIYLNENEMERSIWFWTKYSSFTDIDNDGIIDPFIVYGSEGTNSYDDGRIKLLIFYKGEKIAIRHQNGILDHIRNTQVDPKFYTLPASVQGHVKAAMNKITEHRRGIFPVGWEKNMKNKKTKFSESSSN